MVVTDGETERAYDMKKVFDHCVGEYNRTNRVSWGNSSFPIRTATTRELSVLWGLGSTPHPPPSLPTASKRTGMSATK